MDFRIKSLAAEPFADLFGLSETELAARHGRREVVAAKPGTPCRISLEEAEIGETVLLVNYLHQAGNSPYRSAHAIYVREHARPARLAVNEIPDVIRSRLISLRFFDAAHMMVAADVVPGDAVAEAIRAAFADDRVAYGHVHNAKQGCFAASVHRVG